MGIPLTAIFEGIAAFIKWKAAYAELALKERVVNKLERLEDEYEQMFKELDQIWIKMRDPNTPHDVVNGLLQNYENLIIRIARRGQLRADVAKRCVALGWRPDDPDARRSIQAEAGRNVLERKKVSELWGEGDRRSEGNRQGGFEGEPRLKENDKVNPTT